MIGGTVLKPLGEVEAEIRGGSGLSMLESWSAREAALECILYIIFISYRKEQKGEWWLKVVEKG